MDTSIIGVGVAAFAGVASGLSPAPIKFMARYRFEHWAFVNALVAFFLLPWGLAFALCPNLLTVVGQLPFAVCLKANLWSLAWGVANLLCGLCLLRIGLSLTMGLLTGVGLPVGMLLPMVIKGSGQFQAAPSLVSWTGCALIGLAALLVLSVILMARAGFQRERDEVQMRGAFRSGLVMAVTAGFLQVGLSFAFVYSQGSLIEGAKAQGAGEVGAAAVVWAATLPGGALVNVCYPLVRLMRRHNFRTLLFARDLVLTLAMSLLFVTCLLSMSVGMRMMGALGASVGFGLYQGLQTLTSQGVGLLTGEWKCALPQTRRQMVGGVALMLVAVLILAVLESE